MMNNRTELQQEVIEQARQVLIEQHNCSKICLDTLPTDKEIIEDREKAISSLVDDTCMWEGLWF